MKKTLFLVLSLITFITTTKAQQKQITLEEIWGGAFRTEGLEVLRSMNNGKQYTILNVNRSSQGSSIDKYDYKTLEKVETIVSSSNSENIP
ncbi:MAG: S9 family peptidase, partial [Bacteroidota bacterium]